MASPDVPARRSRLAEVPAAPRWPSARARRLVFRYTGSQQVLRLLGAVFVAIGLASLVPLAWGLPSDIAIAMAKREATGRVLRTARAGYSAGSEVPLRVYYRYELGGRRYEASSDVFSRSMQSLGAALEQEGTVPVEVAAVHPAFSRIAGTRNWIFFPSILPTLVLLLVGGTMLFFAIRSNRREIRAFVHGVPALAKVVSVGEDRFTRLNGKHPLVVAWEFDVGGKAYKGSLSSLRAPELEELLDAREVVILYDPERPRTNTLYVP